MPYPGASRREENHANRQAQLLQQNLKAAKAERERQAREADEARKAAARDRARAARQTRNNRRQY
jgi:hypothetical protein